MLESSSSTSINTSTMHQHRYHQARKITLIGAASNTLQGIFKVIGGLYFNSHALIADGLHSFSDLLTDLLVIFGSHYGSLDADEAHPYGHQRIETATTLFVSLLLISAGVGIGWHVFEAWSSATLESPTLGALLIAIASILLNEILFISTLRVGEKILSELVKANAWHHRSDSASSLVVTIGIAGSMLGYAYLDALAAIIVAALIIKMGLVYTWNSLKELIDTAVNPELSTQIETVIAAVPGVSKIHQLRTRSMGSQVLVDVHILVVPYLSVSEGHYIAQHVHHALIKQLPVVNDVTVHVDPEDDEVYPPSAHLANRKTMEQKWILPLQATFPDIQSWTLHYLAGQITLDLYLKPSKTKHASLIHYCQTHFSQAKDIKTIRLFTVGQVLTLHVDNA